MLRKILIVTVLIAAGSAAWSAGQLPKLETKARSINVFKNGLGFVFRSGTTPLLDGWADFDGTPPAALGTLWIGTTNPAAGVDQVVAYTATSDAEHDATTLAALVDLNVGRQMAITYSTGGTAEVKRIEGKILSSPGQIVLVQTNDKPGTGKVAINKASIQSLEMLDEAELKSKSSETTNKAKVHVKGAPKSAEITMAYLEKGLTWSPSYLIDISNDSTAEITMEAVLANDVEDLDDADVSFVVGFPNFQFADITTPMSLQQSVSAFISAIANNRSDDYAGRIMSQSIAFNNAAYSSSVQAILASDFGYSATAPMAGEPSEDLYLYRQQHVTVKKGDRAKYTVFSGKSPYEHVYELALPDSINIDFSGYRVEPNRKDDGPQVWHVLRLENSIGQPWTTAPALVVNGNTPVAQDTLTYTPPKAKSTLKLTVASDVRAQAQQVEVGRTQSGNYDSVTVKGQVVLRSYKPKPIKVSVRKAITGEVASASEGGKIVKLAKAINAVNSSSEVSWELELAPGAEKTLEYQYTVLIRR